MASPWRVLPLGYPRIKACLAAPRGLSQLATSFIASSCQDVHRLPLLRLCDTHSIHLSRTARGFRRATFDSTTRPRGCQAQQVGDQNGETLPGDGLLVNPSFRTAEGRFPGLLPCHALSEAGGPRASKAGTDAAAYESCAALSVRDTAIASRSSSSKERVSPRTVGSIAAARMTSATPSAGSRSRSAPRIIFRLLP